MKHEIETKTLFRLQLEQFENISDPQRLNKCKESLKICLLRGLLERSLSIHQFKCDNSFSRAFAAIVMKQ